MSMRTALPAALLAVAACAAPPPAAAPPPPAVVTAAPAAPPPAEPWTPPARCRPTGPAASLDRAFAALPTPPLPARRAAGPAKRGKRAAIRKVDVSVMFKPAPHHGNYFINPQPRIDRSADRICGLALAYPRLAPADQRALDAILGRRRGRSPNVAPTAEEIRAFAEQTSAPARFAGAMLSLLREADIGSAHSNEPFELLRSVARALPAADPLGARARLEIVDSVAMANELTASLSWADASTLFRLAEALHQGIDSTAAFHAAIVAASLADTDTARADALLFGAMASMDWEPAAVTFAYGDRLATSQALFAALDEPSRDALGSILAHDLEVLPDGGVDAMLRWPAPLLRDVLRATRYPLSRYAPLYQRLGEPLPAPSGKWDLEDRVDSLVRACVYRLPQRKLHFRLEVGVFDAGPPEVKVEGAPSIARCLEESAGAFFEGATESVSSKVDVGEWGMD